MDRQQQRRRHQPRAGVEVARGGGERHAGGAEQAGETARPRVRVFIGVSGIAPIWRRSRPSTSAFRAALAISTRPTLRQRPRTL